MSRILCLRFPLWPLQQRIAAQPELRGRTLALFARNGSRGERVTLCSPEAHGLRVEMPVAEASVIDSRPTAPRRPAAENANDSRIRLPRSDQPTLFLPHDAGADRAALEQLAAWCERYSPVVGVAALFGGEEAPCEKFRARCNSAATQCNSASPIRSGLRGPLLNAKCGVKKVVAQATPHFVLAFA